MFHQEIHPWLVLTRCCIGSASNELFASKREADANAKRMNWRLGSGYRKAVEAGWGRKLFLIGAFRSISLPHPTSLGLQPKNRHSRFSREDRHPAQFTRQFFCPRMFCNLPPSKKSGTTAPTGCAMKDPGSVQSGFPLKTEPSRLTCLELMAGV